jgi:hypothetical protein
MSLHMSLWQVSGTKLREITRSRLDNEIRLEDWIAADVTILGLELLIIGRQVVTDFRGRIDLLAIDAEGNLVILELKRDRTSRDIVAQTLDYASWIKNLSYQHILTIAQNYLGKPLPVYFKSHFGAPLPEKVNIAQNMIIVASELDGISERIVQYLAEEYGVNINVIFFNFYQVDGKELLGRAWLMDPASLEERTISRTQPPWTGYYFVNVGDGKHRCWEDNVKYGYIGAGQGPRFARSLQTLRPDDRVFAYLKGRGYVGYGVVIEEAVPITEFIVEATGRSLLEQPLKALLAYENKDNPEMCEWAVRVNWVKTFNWEEARTFSGIFANPNVVCKLRHPETLQFVEQEFEVDSTTIPGD